MNHYLLLRNCIFSCLIFTVISWGASSCVSPKSIVYFQGDTTRYGESEILDTFVPIIQKNDMLSILIGSLSPEANEIFNTFNTYTSSSTNYGAGGGDTRQPFGYLVDSEGSVELPLIGKVKLEGLRTQTAADTIRQRLLQYLKDPSVTIRITNFKVSVLGEVNRPSVYTIPDEKISLPEVLSLAGDLTIYGRRDNIMIIREEDGNRNYIRVDLTARSIFDSPYYYLRKNDIVYVEPTKVRMASTDRTMQLVPIVVSVITALSLVLIRINN